MRKLINSREVGQVYGFKEGTLRYWRSEKIGPEYFKVGKNIMYDVATLEAWLNQHKVTPSVSLAVEESYGSISKR